MNRCPKRAIETAHGYVAASLLLFYGAMSALAYPALRRVVPAISAHGVLPALVRFIFQSVTMLAALFGSYRLLHLGTALPNDRATCGPDLVHALRLLATLSTTGHDGGEVTACPEPGESPGRTPAKADGKSG